MARYALMLALWGDPSGEYVSPIGNMFIVVTRIDGSDRYAVQHYQLSIWQVFPELKYIGVLEMTDRGWLETTTTPDGRGTVWHTATAPYGFWMLYGVGKYNHPGQWYARVK